MGIGEGFGQNFHFRGFELLNMHMKNDFEGQMCIACGSIVSW